MHQVVYVKIKNRLRPGQIYCRDHLESKKMQKGVN